MPHAFSLAALLVALVLVPAAAAEPRSTSFTITGYEYAFTSTAGSFAGRAVGDAGDTGFWNATVKHDRLGGSTRASVNGGAFAITVRPPGGGIDAVAGAFARRRGTITTLRSGENCGNQQYRVTAKIREVLTPQSSGGSGTLKAILTHYRVRVLGRCVAYKARVAGTVSFRY